MSERVWVWPCTMQAQVGISTWLGLGDMSLRLISVSCHENESSENAEENPTEMSDSFLKPTLLSSLELYVPGLYNLRYFLNFHIITCL